MSTDNKTAENGLMPSLETIFMGDSIINDDLVFERYADEKKLLYFVVAGNYEQALLIWDRAPKEPSYYADLIARVPGDHDRLLRNLAWILNSTLRVTLLFTHVPVNYVHIVATHFGMMIEHIPVELLVNQQMFHNMLEVYCHAAKEFGNRKYSKTVEKITNYILSNLQTELTLNQIAQVFNFSPAYINRLLKKETGFSTIQYIKKQRISLAKILLHFDDMAVADIASIVGYPDSAYFCRVFKQTEHLSPLQYKVQNKGR